MNEGQTLDPGFWLDLVKGTDRVTELDDREADGTTQFGLAADVPLVSMLEAQGLDPDTVLSGVEHGSVIEDVDVPIDLPADTIDLTEFVQDL